MNRSPFQGLRPVLGPGLKRLELAWVTADPQDKRQIEMAAELLRRSISPNGKPLLEPPSGKEADGEIWLGRILHGDRKLGWAGLQRDQLCSHMGVFGTTGAGKTTACASVLLRLMELGVPWVTLDPKRSLRCIAAMPTSKPVTILTTGRQVGHQLRFNPFAPPPGADPQSHTAEVIQLLSDTWHGGPGIASLLERAVREAWKANGVPTFRDMLRALDAIGLKGREGTWMQSARRILSTVAEGRLGRVFAPDSSVTQKDSISTLLKSWTVIETDGLTREEASFLVSTLLLQIHQRLQATASREALKLVLMIDEAEQLLVKRDAHRESLLERMIRVSRESGLSICVASQSISKMTSTILQNLGTLIAMRAHHRDDVSVIARMLMLPDHAMPLIGTLGVGQAVCRVPHWPSPIHLEIPQLQLPKGAVDDAMLVSNDQTTSKHHQLLEAIEYATMRDWSDSADSGCSTPDGEHPPHQAVNTPIPLADSAWCSEREHAKSVSQSVSDEPSPTTTDLLQTNPDLQALLRHIAVDPFATVTARYTQLSFSRRRGNALRQHLEELGLIKPIRIKTPRGMVMLLELTGSARSWLKKKRARITPLNGGIKHAFWQWEVKRLLEAQGWRVETEWRPPDEEHAFDLAAWKGDQSLLTEVETGMSRWRNNLEALESTKATHKAMLWIGEPNAIQHHKLDLKSVTILLPTQLPKWLPQLDPPEVSSTPAKTDPLLSI